MHTESQYPGNGKHRYRRGYGKYGRQQITGCHGSRQRDQHTEIEHTACGTESQGKQNPYQQGSPAPSLRQSFRITAEPELGQVQSVAHEHEQSDDQEQRSQCQFTPCTDHLLDAEHTGSLFQNQDQHHTKQGVSQNTSQRIEQTVAENLPPVLNVLSDKPHRCNVRGQRTGRKSRKQAQQKRSQKRRGTVVQPCL